MLTEPLPSMPVFFWDDPDGARYRESYFSIYPGDLAPRRLDRDHRARHGDHLRPLGLDDQPRRRPDGDERDLPRGARASTRCVDALVVDLPREGTSGWIPLFVVLRDGAELDDELAREIERRIREDCSPRHVPDEIRAVAEVPRTLSGKVLEVPVKRILMGAEPDDGREPRLAREPARARLRSSSSPPSSPSEATT